MRMKTRGTNTATMPDSELRSSIVDAALDVAREANRPSATDYEIHFASGTLYRLTHELRARSTNKVEDVPERASDASPTLLP